MRIDILTLFPDIMGDMLCESILGRAQERGLIRIECHQIRDYTLNKQMQVDDYPYGGGFGMVMQADPLYHCWEHVCQEAGRRVHTIYLSPAGKLFRQEDAKRLSTSLDRFILVCGHYEGVDERFLEECVDEELSIGDFVLTGGEIPALAIADAVCRLVPGVLADENCYTDDSHWNGLLEYPQYSRPEVWHDRTVPSILLSGHHANISKWRRLQSFKRTRIRRPDLWEAFLKQPKDKADLKLLKQLEDETTADE
jgi:tRNA (guanine37-N1)-methyltransferase